MIERAIERGVTFLTGAVDATGLWREYVTADRPGSNVWTSAFIAAHLGRVDGARDVATTVVHNLLALERPSGGWGYDEGLLEDCDSTSWVLLAARACGVRVPKDLLVRALRFLLRHQGACGGFPTYGPRGVELFGDVAGREGWFVPQPCVSAAALAALATYAPRELPETTMAAAYLRGRATDGLWRAYWWYGPAYATYHAVVALDLAGALDDTQKKTIGDALLGARLADGGWAGKDDDRSIAFATALALLTLLRVDAPDDALDAAAERLVSMQSGSGVFSPSAELLVPGGAPARTLTLLDGGAFTTACAVHALDALRARRASPPRALSTFVPWDNIPWEEQAAQLVRCRVGDGFVGLRAPEVVDAHVEALAERLSLGPGSTVLDVGCGPGMYASRLGARGHRVTGIDIAEPVIAYARAEAEARRLPCAYERKSMFAIDDREAFDGVFLTNSIVNHLREDELGDLFSRVRRALTPGGRFALDFCPLPADYATRPASRTRRRFVLPSSPWGDRPHTWVEHTLVFPGEGQRVAHHVITFDDGERREHWSRFVLLPPEVMRAALGAAHLELEGLFEADLRTPARPASDLLWAVARAVR